MEDHGIFEYKEKGDGFLRGYGGGFGSPASRLVLSPAEEIEASAEERKVDENKYLQQTKSC